MDRVEGSFYSSEGTNYIVELDFSPVYKDFVYRFLPTDLTNKTGFRWFILLIFKPK